MPQLRGNICSGRLWQSAIRCLGKDGGEVGIPARVDTRPLLQTQ